MNIDSMIIVQQRNAIGGIRLLRLIDISLKR